MLNSSYDNYLADAFGLSRGVIADKPWQSHLRKLVGHGRLDPLVIARLAKSAEAISG